LIVNNLDVSYFSLLKKHDFQ